MSDAIGGTVLVESDPFLMFRNLYFCAAAELLMTVPDEDACWYTECPPEGVTDV